MCALRRLLISVIPFAHTFVNARADNFPMWQLCKFVILLPINLVTTVVVIVHWLPGPSILPLVDPWTGGPILPVTREVARGRNLSQEWFTWWSLLHDIFAPSGICSLGENFTFWLGVILTCCTTVATAAVRMTTFRWRVTRCKRSWQSFHYLSYLNYKVGSSAC